MTDNEIIKALECCSAPHCNNNKCPMYNNTINTKDCITKLSTNALDLINRQKAEIERLNVELQGMRGAANSYKMHYNKVIKEFAERLISDMQFIPQHRFTLAEVKMTIDNILKEMEQGEA